MRSTAGLPPAHRRRQFLSAARPASRAKGKRHRRGGMAGAGLMSVAAWPQSPPDPGHLRARDYELDHAPRLAAVEAISQARGGLPSGASGCDRIVGTMSASGPHGALPSNRRRGATMGTPACIRPVLSVPSRRRRWTRLQGLRASWDDWRRQKSFLMRKGYPGSSPGSPTPRNPGIRCICGSARPGCSMGP